MSNQCCQKLTAKIKEYASTHGWVEVRKDPKREVPLLRQDDMLAFLDTLNTSQVESKEVEDEAILRNS